MMTKEEFLEKTVNDFVKGWRKRLSDDNDKVEKITFISDYYTMGRQLRQGIFCYAKSLTKKDKDGTLVRYGYSIDWSIDEMEFPSDKELYGFAKVVEYLVNKEIQNG